MSGYVFLSAAVPPIQPRARDKAVVGGKGANLAGMAAIGLPVPPGFTISAEICAAYAQGEHRIDDALRGSRAGLAHIENVTGRGFGDPVNPLLVSVRSGARVSMPGMMDTVLDLGLNDATVLGLAEARATRALPGIPIAASSRSMAMWRWASTITLRGCSGDRQGRQWFLHRCRDGRSIGRRSSPNTRHRRAETGAPFPQDVGEQLWGAIVAVFDSWDSERARSIAG
jgi:pyruvate,orthophosphate dikinase